MLRLRLLVVWLFGWGSAACLPLSARTILLYLSLCRLLVLMLMRLRLLLRPCLVYGLIRITILVRRCLADFGCRSNGL